MLRAWPLMYSFWSLRQSLQHRAHTAVGPHGLEQMQSVGSNPGIGVVHQRLEQSIPHPRIALHICAQSIQRFQSHSRIRVITQGIHQCFAHVHVVRLLGQKIDRIHAHARVVIVARRKQQQLLDALIVQRTLRLLRGNRLVLDA